MIYKLRKKFIKIAMISVVLVLFAMIGTINVLNYVSVCRNADQRLQILTDNDGRLPFGPGGGPGEGSGFDGMGTPGEETNDSEADDLDDPGQDAAVNDAAKNSEKDPDDVRGRDGFFRNALSGEAMYEIRYFTVTLDETGAVTETDTSGIATVSEDTAIACAQSLFEKSKIHGFYKTYRYTVIREDSGSKYVFLNCEREISSFRSFLLSSLLISVIGVALVFLLVVFLSRQAVRPIAENYKKQKQFITDAGHELKTPLTIIDAYAEIIEMDDEGNEYVAGIKNQVARMTDLTNNLIFLSKTEEDGSSLQMEDFSLTDALEDLLGPYRTMAEKAGKTLTAETGGDVHFYGDEYSMRRLITLLMDNALKYSSDHGEIAVRLERSGGQTRFSVKNTVDDIEIGDLDILFDRFYRRDASRNSETGGSGIGLATARAIVEAHKGTIHARGIDSEHFIITAVFKK